MKLKDIENKMYKQMCNNAKEEIKKLLENLDRDLSGNVNKEIYIKEGRKEKRKLSTIFGTVEYEIERYLYIDKDGKMKYKTLLEEKIDLDTKNRDFIKIIDVL